MSQVLCAAPLVCLQVDSGRRNISYLTPDEELLERLRKDRPQHATGPVCATSWRRQYHGAGSRCSANLGRVIESVTSYSACRSGSSLRSVGAR